MNRKIGIGVLWNISNILASRGASLLFTLFLARFLTPEAFGLIAMVTVVFEVAGAFVQSGLGQAVIRSKIITQLDLTTVFFANLGLSIAAYTALFFFAPYISDFYNQEALTHVIRIMGLVVFLNAAKVIQISVLSRKMNFKAQMKANTLGVLLSGVIAVLAAYLGAEVWSLVIQMLVSSAASAMLLWFASDWRPSWGFSLSSFRRLFGFGVNLLAEGLLDKLYQNSIVLVVGKLFSAEITGLYFFSKKVSQIMSQQLTAAVQQATFPALSRLQEQNTLLRNKYRQIIQMIMFIVSPAMFLTAGMAEPIFQLLFSRKWLPAVPYFQLLSFIAVLLPLHSLNINILNVKGRSDLVLKIGVVKKAINIAILCATAKFGVAAIIVGQIVGSVIALAPNTFFTKKLIGYSLTDQLLDSFKPLVAALLSGWVALHYFSKNTPDFLWLFLNMSISLTLYLAISLLLRSEGLFYVFLGVKKLYRKSWIPNSP